MVLLLLGRDTQESTYLRIRIPSDNNLPTKIKTIMAQHNAHGISIRF